MEGYQTFLRGYTKFQKVNSGENQFNDMQKHLSKLNYRKLTSQLDTVDGHWGMICFLIVQWGINIFIENLKGWENFSPV